MSKSYARTFSWESGRPGSNSGYSDRAGIKNWSGTKVEKLNPGWFFTDEMNQPVINVVSNRFITFSVPADLLKNSFSNSFYVIGAGFRLFSRFEIESKLL